jgi:hypothetical protein
VIGKRAEVGDQVFRCKSPADILGQAGARPRIRMETGTDDCLLPPGLVGSVNNVVFSRVGGDESRGPCSLPPCVHFVSAESHPINPIDRWPLTIAKMPTSSPTYLSGFGFGVF